ncbi:MAG: hypothetical protein QOJ92_1065 [Frankiales bacterium]|nr:hypothetical protein [Frankiales bacterium]
MSPSSLARVTAPQRAWRALTRPFQGPGVPESSGLTLLAVCTAALSTVDARFPAWVPPASLALPLLVGGFLLRPPFFRWLAAAVGLGLAIDIAVLGVDRVRPGNVLIIALIGLVALRLSRIRALTGVQGLRGDTMLVDLRDRLQAHGSMPDLPAGWMSEVVIRSASRASSFSGDFLVAATDHDRRILEIALVDVSGKGVEAGTRALLLSGALGGLLGSVPPEEFLPAANSYLLRQQWNEGFATAVHLVVDLETGQYLLDSAGHPPAAHFEAGSGRWRLAAVEGTVLGLEPKPTYVADRGVMRPGDAVLLYTDGVVETPGRDLAVGIDKLLGEAERLIARGFGGGARWLVEKASPSKSDDRAVVLIHRT